MQSHEGRLHTTHIPGEEREEEEEVVVEVVLEVVVEMNKNEKRSTKRTQRQLPLLLPVAFYGIHQRQTQPPLRPCSLSSPD